MKQAGVQYCRDDQYDMKSFLQFSTLCPSVSYCVCLVTSWLTSILQWILHVVINVSTKN